MQSRDKIDEICKHIVVFVLRRIQNFELWFCVPVNSHGHVGTLPRAILWDFYPKLGCHDNLIIIIIMCFCILHRFFMLGFAVYGTTHPGFC